MWFPGPIGSQLPNVESLDINRRFTCVKFSEVECPDEIFNDLSSDQKALVSLARVVCTGVILENFEQYALGKMHNARYLFLLFYS